MIRYTDINTGNDLLDQSLERYLMNGIPPGGFLTSVLANDLYLAVGRADQWNQDRLYHIVNVVLHKMPNWSWGSYQRVKDWCADKDGRRSAYADIKQKEYVMKILKGEVREKVHQDPPF